MFRNLATNLVLHNRIKTTLPKAKELRRVAEKLVTVAKKNTLHARRQAMGFLQAIDKSEVGDAKKLSAVHILFTEIAPRFADRNGGYTRIVKIGPRLGDKAPLAWIEFVEGAAPEKKERKKRRVVKKASAESTASQPST